MDMQKMMENSLSLEELEHVSGGADAECMADLVMFTIFTKIRPYLGSRPTSVTPELVAGLEAAFSMFGVEAKLRKDDKPGYKVYNRYSINGKVVSRDAAWLHIMKQHPENLGTTMFNPQD